MSDLPKMSTWGTQGQKYEICDQAARERNTQLGKETESIRNEVGALKTDIAVLQALGLQIVNGQICQAYKEA